MQLKSRTKLLGVFVSALILAAAAYSQAPSPSPAPGDAAFQKNVVPVLAKTCSPCHNSQVASGGLNVANFQKRNSLTENREAWEIIARKVRSGEMPPAGMP